jgi:hypothetical protein
MWRRRITSSRRRLASKEAGINEKEFSSPRRGGFLGKEEHSKVRRCVPR